VNFSEFILDTFCH